MEDSQKTVHYVVSVQVTGMAASQNFELILRSSDGLRDTLSASVIEQHVNEDGLSFDEQQRRADEQNSRVDERRRANIKFELGVLDATLALESKHREPDLREPDLRGGAAYVASFFKLVPNAVWNAVWGRIGCLKRYLTIGNSFHVVVEAAGELCTDLDHLAGQQLVATMQLEHEAIEVICRIRRLDEFDADASNYTEDSFERGVAQRSGFVEMMNVVFDHIRIGDDMHAKYICKQLHLFDDPTTDKKGRKHCSRCGYFI